MTGDELDLLADYAAGLLDGTPDRDVVAARIATDPEWADAYEALRVADAEVHDLLAGLPPVSIPPDVAARLTTALDAARLADGPSTAGGGPRTDDGEDATGGSPAPSRGVVVPLHRSARVLAGLAAGVAVLAGAVFGVQYLRSTSDPGTASGSAESAADTSARSDSGAAPTAPTAPTAPSGPDTATRRYATGTDYTAATLADQARALLAPAGSTGTPSPPGMQEAERPRASGALSRLADPAGLASCLAALGQPSPLATDYARFGGEPALILLIPAQSGEVTIVVVGPSCGAASPGTGRGAADERYRTTVTR